MPFHKALKRKKKNNRKTQKNIKRFKRVGKTQRKRRVNEIKRRSGTGRVIPPTPEYIMPQMLTILSKCNRVRLPRQYSSNCWLNACITSFFASQGMSAVGLPLRRMLHNPTSNLTHHLSSRIKVDLRRLSNVIESIPLGIIDSMYSSAALIKGLLAIDNNGLTTPRNRLGASIGQSHNPLWMYSALAKLLLPGSYQILKCDLTDNTGVIHATLKTALDACEIYNSSPHEASPLRSRVLFIEAGQETAETKARKELLSAIAAQHHINARGTRWRLDSVVMLDTTNSHFGGIVTCGGVPHSYDGMTGAELYPKQSWQHVVELFRGRKIPTPSPQEFKYNIHTGYVIFAFVSI